LLLVCGGSIEVLLNLSMSSYSPSTRTIKRKPHNDGFEFSIHPCPPAFERELTHIFPDMNCEHIVAIPTMQHALCDLVDIGENVEFEKDRLLNEVYFKAICKNE
jgi:hypothetical protein